MPLIEFPFMIARQGKMLITAALPLILVALLSVTLPAAAQPLHPLFSLDPTQELSQFTHDVWQDAQGLPQNSVQALAQTPDGYLWLGLEEGLVRFDGLRFQVFSEGNVTALHHDNIVALLVDHAGRLWIATRGGGLNCYSGGEFTHFGKREGLLHEVIMCLHEDNRNQLWVGTNGGGLHRFENGKFISYTTAEGLASNNISALGSDDDNNLWIGTEDNGLSRFRDNQFVNFNVQAGLPSNTITALAHAPQGPLWIGTTAGLVRAEGERFTLSTTAAGLPHNSIKTLLLDRNRSLWIGTIGGGLSRLVNGRFFNYSTHEGLSSDFVYNFLEDREGSMWIGTYGGGLNRLRQGKFSTISHTSGLPNEMVWSVLADQRGGLLIGTEKGLYRYARGAFENNPEFAPLANKIILALHETHDGTLWVGTEGNGLFRFTAHQTQHLTTAHGLAHSTVRVVHEDRQGTIWIGTNQGLNYLRRDRPTVLLKAEAIPNDRVAAIYEDRAGRLWFGTGQSGLYSFASNQFKAYTTEDGLSSNFVRAFYEDESGTMWIGTRGGGLNRLRDGKFTNYREQNGLFDDVVFQILPDTLGNLWMSCNKGVFRVALAQLNDFAEGRRTAITCVAYGKAEGMKSNECNGGSQPAGCRGQDNRLWFPTIKGVAVVDPCHLPSNPLPPPVVIEALRVNQKSLPLQNGLALAPGTNNFEFQYTGLSFLGPSQMHFQYKLEGFDEEWRDAGTRRTAYYTNVAPAEYTFRVRASNNDGVWNETGAAFKFRLQPFFYQTKWFYAACVLLLFVGGAGAVRLRVRNIKARAQELAQLVKERTSALQQEVEERKRAEAKLRAARDELEMRVQARTAALQESEQRWLFALEGNGDGVWDWNIPDKTVFYSKRWKEMLGYADHEIGTGPEEWSTRVHPEDLAATRDLLWRHVQGETAEYVSEHRLRCKDGSYKWILDRGRVMAHTPEGKPLRVVGTHSDITARKLAAQKLYESEERFRQLAENVEEVFWMTDPEKNQMVYASPAFEKIWGRPLDSVYADPRLWLEAIHPEDRERVLQAALTKQVEGGYDEVYRITRPDGTMRWIRDRAFPVHNTEGKVYRIAGIAEDITAARASEEQMLALKNFYETIIDQIPTQIVLFDTELRHVYVNPSAVKEAALRQWMIGKTSLEYCRYRGIAEEIGLRRMELVAQCFATGKTSSFEESFPSDEAGTRQLLRFCSPILDNAGRIVRVLSYSIDITEHKQAEQALRQSEARFHAIVEATPIPMLISRTKDSQVLYANDQVQETFGVQISSLIGSKAADLYYDQHDREAIVAAVKRDGYLRNYEVQARKADGSPFWVMVAVQALVLDGEECLLVGFYDITKRRAAEAEVRQLNEALERRVRERTRELQDSEERLRQIADNIDEVLWIESRQPHGLLYVSPNYERVWGRTPESLLAEPGAFMESVYKEDRERVRGHLQKQRRGEFSEMEYRIVRPDGTVRWVWDRSFPIQDREGRVYRTAGMAEDITARKHAEELERERTARIIRHQAALLRLTQMDNNDLHEFQKQTLEVSARTLQVERVSIWYYDAERTAIVCDDLFSLSRNAHEHGVRLEAVSFPNYFQVLEENRIIAAHEAQTDPRTADFTASYLQPLGITSMMDVPIWLHGQVVGIICHEHTATARTWTHDEQEFATSMADQLSLALEAAERVRAENALRQSEALKSAILSSALDAIITIDAEGKVLEFNPAAEKVFGYTQAEIVGRTMQHFIIPPQFREAHQHGMARYLATGTSEVLGTRLELSAMRANGEEFPVELTISRIVADGPPKFTAFLRDISLRKAMEEQLRQHAEELEKLVTQRAQRIHELERQRTENEKLAAAGRLAARIAHEINNPLGGIKNSFLLVKDAIKPDHPYHHYVPRIEKEIDRIARIVRQMFELNKPDQELARSFKVEETIREIIAILEPSRREHGARFELALASAAQPINMPEGLLRQVLFNVLQNAIEASPMGGKIKIAASIKENVLYLAVSDEGPGIPEELRERVFEPLFTTKSGLLNSGMGLGLSVCKNIVDALKGKITFASELGNGTTFTIELPI